MAAVFDTPSIGQRLDQLPLKRLHVGALLCCILAMACTLSEISLSGALSAIWSSGPNKATAGQLSMLLSAVYVGAIVGAPLLGYMADRRGRRATLVLALGWIAAMSVAAGFARDIQQLVVCRGLAGLALGAMPPLVIAFLADLMPPQRRGPLTLWCVALSTLGPMCTLLSLRAMSGIPGLGIEAWRLTFWLLAAACAFTAAIAMMLPESPRFLAVRGRELEASRAVERYEQSQALGWAGGGTSAPPVAAASYTPVGRRTYLVFLLFALSPWGTAAFPILWGAVLTERGFALNDALLVVGLSTIGPILGNIATSLGIDKIDRRYSLIACSVVMICAGATFVTADVAWHAFAGAACYGMAGSVYLSVLNLYAAEFFPTEARGRHLARAWALNRVGAAVAPLLLVPLLRSHGALQMFAVIASVVLAGIATTCVSPRGRQRQSIS